MLALTLAATWYAVYNLASHPRAQPGAFAFGGEANRGHVGAALRLAPGWTGPGQ